MKTEPPPGYVTSKELYELDKKLRKRYCLSPRANQRSFSWQLGHKKIRHFVKNNSLGYWDVEHFFDVFTEMYEHNGHMCRTRSSVSKSHLIATRTIQNDPEYLPLKQAATTIGCTTARLAAMVANNAVIAYFDTTRKRLLYPVKECRELAQYRRFSFIWKHLGEEKAKELRSIRKARHWNYGNGICSMYYVPELAHL